MHCEKANVFACEYVFGYNFKGQPYNGFHMLEAYKN